MKTNHTPNCLETAKALCPESQTESDPVSFADSAVLEGECSLDRRKLLGHLMTIGAAGLAYAVAGGSLIDTMATPVAAQDESAQLHRWGMAIDTRRCVGCRACTIACKSENKTPPGVSYTNIHTDLLPDHIGIKPLFMTKPCFHCQNPICVVVCPVDATWKRTSDGIVVINYDTCIECGKCVTACPYGNRYMDTRDDYPAVAENTAWAGVPSPEYQQFRIRKEGQPPMGKARKCTFCVHLQDENGQYNKGEGLWPSCAKTCTGHAIHFGDLDDPESEVSRLIAERSSIRLKENLGTSPNVYYLM